MPTRNLFIIRIALMTGVFMFAGIAYFGPRFGMVQQFELGETVDSLRWVARAFFALAVTVAVLLRSKIESAPPGRLPQYLIGGWAVGEAAALMGVVTFMGGGGTAPLSLGLMAFVFTLVLLPIPRSRR
jgi:hypothetical protein